MNRFKGKVALVTGAASGIGLATLRRLAAEGARVLACDMNAAPLKAAVDPLEAAGLQAKALVLDVTDAEACRGAVAAAVAYGDGRLDILCNIAGIGQFKHFTDVTQSDWDKVIAVNLTSLFVLSQAALPHLLESKGNIVNMASSAGLVGIAYNAAYCASKGGVVLLTKALAAEYAGRGVRVNAVCPGAVNTPLASHFRAVEGLDMALIGRAHPLTPYHSEPEEIAGAVAYLASDEARFVTGHTLAIDGAQTAV